MALLSLGGSPQFDEFFEGIRYLYCMPALAALLFTVLYTVIPMGYLEVQNPSRPCDSVNHDLNYRPVNLIDLLRPCLAVGSGYVKRTTSASEPPGSEFIETNPRLLNRQDTQTQHIDN
jgi:hypothetical protein